MFGLWLAYRCRLPRHSIEALAIRMLRQRLLAGMRFSERVSRDYEASFAYRWHPRVPPPRPPGYVVKVRLPRRYQQP